MKKKYVNIARILNLQMFAEGGEGGDDPDGGEGGGQILSFDDFLEQEGNLAEFNTRVKKEVDAAVNAAQQKWKALTDDKLSEAEKLAKMTQEEKDEYLRQKERKEFEAEKAEFEKEKLLVEVNKELQAQSLPLEFATSLVNIGDAEKIKEAITGIKKAWDAQITEAIKVKARQDPPKEGGGSAGRVSQLSDIREMAKANRIIKN